MHGELATMVSKMIGTLAVILVVSAFIGGSDNISNAFKAGKKWKYKVLLGFLGGIFGMYGNISGFELNGAVVSVRDMGPMLAAFSGGPVAGVIAGLIAGLHRFTMGGVTATACVVATCCIGIICGLLAMKWSQMMRKPQYAFLIAAGMEIFHLSLVLIMVRPFSTAVDIVKQIAIPFILINAIGFAVMIAIMDYIDKHNSLIGEKSRLQSELEVARKIQHSLLPVFNEHYPGRDDLEVSGFMEAAKEVGGDFYDLFFVDSNHMAILIGDVSGKGVPAAIFMASCKIILQNCLRNAPTLKDAVETANNAICNNNDAEMFVTVWVGVLDLETRELQFVSAGHNPPVVLRDNKPWFLKCKNCLVLAGMEGVKYRENSAQLQAGDMLLLYTDGVTEAEDAEHNLFGDDRLLECFNDKSESTPKEMIDDVKNSIDVFIKGNSQFDDMTMLCLKLK